MVLTEISHNTIHSTSLPSSRSMTIREECSFQPTYQRFLLKTKSFTQQYSHFYMNRLHQLRPSVMKQMDTDIPVLEKVIDIVGSKPCGLIGTIFKEMLHKPKVLEEITEEEGIVPLPTRKFCSLQDRLILEDDTGRVELVGNIPKQALVTGVIVGIQGYVNAENFFEVEKYWIAGMAPLKPFPSQQENQYVVLMSGLQIGSATSSRMKIQLLMDYLAGRLGVDTEEQFVSKLVRVIIAGNSVCPSTVPLQDGTSSQQKQFELKQQAKTIKEADFLISQLVNCTYVDLMAGPEDPSTFTFPQQPMHSCLFPYSSSYSSFRLTTNPYAATIGGVEFLGSSGQNIQSVLQCVDELSPIDCLQRTLDWRHIAPTAPDSLGSYPFAMEDPFVLENSPHVYFAGNQPAFDERLYTGPHGDVRLITIPSFATTNQCVVVNLKDLSCTPITIEF